jgi:radical SAM-linked protein
MSFQKSGDLVLLGHLDSMRLLQRLFRRAGARVAYSRGFHPKPRLAVAAPLPVGVAGLAEVADVTLENDVEPECLAESLRPLAPEGLVIRRIRRLDAGEKGAASAVAAADLLLASPALAGDLEQRIEGVLALEELPVRRKKKTLDVRAALLSLEPCRDDELLGRLGITAPAVVARLALGRGATLRPSEVLTALGAQETESELFRLALLTDPLPTPVE